MSASESVIQFTSRTARTLVDGTLRLSVDIEPIHANAAFKLFSMPGTPGAIAALTNNAAQAATPIAAAEKPAESKPPTGPRCREAIGLVNEADFWAFMGEQTSYKADKSMKRHITGMVGKEFTSKRQLDTDDGAFFAAFCELKKDYREWQAENGS